MNRKQATYDDALYWTAEDVGEWIQQIGFYEFVEPLQKHNINGKDLFELSELRLRSLYPNMPTGKSDPASMLFKQINKVKENRRTGKKTKISFGWGSDRKPPKAPVPDYKPPQPNRQNTRDGHGSEEEGWGSDFSEEEDNPEFDQSEDVNASQGNSQGRAPSYNGSSTSSFTNLQNTPVFRRELANLIQRKQKAMSDPMPRSPQKKNLPLHHQGTSVKTLTKSSSASGKDDDSSMLYEAPNQDGDFDQTYEVPIEQMTSSYGDGECEEIYDIPHDDEEEDNRNSLQPDNTRRPHSQGRCSPLPPVLSPRHDPQRPLPTLPPSQHVWPQQQPPPPMQPSHRPGPPPMSQRPAQSPHHFQRQSELQQEEEQEEYEVPSIAEMNQPNYEAPIMDTEEEGEIPEDEYLVPGSDGTGFKPYPGDPGGRPSLFGRPPAPLPSTTSSGMPPPRPVKPPELNVTPARPPSVPDEGPPPPIPSRPVAPRVPMESKGGSKVLPDPPAHVIQEVLNRAPEPRREKSPSRPGHHVSNGSRQDENRNFVSRQKLSSGSAPKLPPPLPKNSPRDTERPPEVSENSGSGSGTVGTISKRLQQFKEMTQDNSESTRPPPPLPRPVGNKPDLSAKPNTGSWINAAVANGNNQPALSNKLPVPAPLGSKPALPSPPHTSASSSVSAPPRPVARPRVPPEPPAATEHKPTPLIPSKEPAKPIKKFTPHSTRSQPDLPRPIAKEPPAPPPTEPERTPPAPRMPQPPTRNEMTGYPWYDADLTRKEAEQILKQSKMDGAFVVRNSTNNNDSIPYSLSLWYNNKVRNLHVRRREDGKYALGSYKDNEQVFETAVLLIQHHMTTPLILAGDAGKTCLKVAAPNFR